MLKINWEVAPKGTYRENGVFEDGEIKLTFDQDPSRLTEPQKQYAIFCKVKVELPEFVAPFIITLGIDKSTEMNCGGFKFRLVGTVNIKGDEIKLPVDFETSGKIFNTIHCNIVDIDGTIISPEIHKLALEIAELGAPSRVDYKARRKENRLEALRNRLAKPAEQVESQDMAGAVE